MSCVDNIDHDCMNRQCYKILKGVELFAELWTDMKEDRYIVVYPSDHL